MLSSISTVRTHQLQTLDTEGKRVAANSDQAGHKAASLGAVKLARTEQIHQLRQQGELDAQIAAKLNLSTKEVDTDLDVVIRWPEILAQAAGSSSPGTASR